LDLSRALERYECHRNQKDFQKQAGEDDKLMRNNARLVAQGFSQVKSLDFGENFALIAHLEAIRILLAFAAFK
jgi:hypothetical protein